MKETIDCFLPCADTASVADVLRQLRGSRMIRRVWLMVTQEFSLRNAAPDGCAYMVVDAPKSSAAVLGMARSVTADYAMIFLGCAPVSLGQYAISRMLRAAVETDAAMVYADRLTVKDGTAERHPVIDWQEGSLRDDFDFGPVVMVKASLLRSFPADVEAVPSGDRLARRLHADRTASGGYAYAGWYELWLYLSRHGRLFHLNEVLCTEFVGGGQASSQFDYVDPANRDVQVEMERVVTAHLAAVGALVDTSSYREPDFNEQDFAVEASVVISVRNREKTICDAVDSALSQVASFPFNVIVVDNHSTDNTTALLDGYSDDRLIHVIPQRTDLGIGGCWNVAVDDPRCGRFAVQLDSDDLYSSPGTLQAIVDAFYEQKAAMIVGSYRMCDFNLNTIPPGLISHAEWTDDNGCNNALRVNGLGAPRAFFTPLLRQIRFPNTSYGEDYAMGLAFSRSYRVGRIFTELYLCRRWGGNSDASLSIEQANANNLYKDRLRTMELMARKKSAAGVGGGLDGDPLRRFFNRQIETWDTARRNFRNLQDVSIRRLAAESCLQAQFNPARIVSTGASVSKEALGRRPCFLCRENRPGEQSAKSFGDGFEILVNPYPILPLHFTIPSRRHEPQLILEHYAEMHRFLAEYPGMTVFYNGPECGASAPDHMHFQAVAGSALPLQAEWPRLQRSLVRLYSLNDDEDISVVSGWVSPALAIRSKSVEADEALFRRVYHALPVAEGQPEPMMNVVSWAADGGHVAVVFLRGKHRPDCYYAEGDGKLLVSPGALDMSGLLITPRKEDFDRITLRQAEDILREVSLTEAQVRVVEDKIRPSSCNLTYADTGACGACGPMVSVGIVSSKEISFMLNGEYEAKGEVVTGHRQVTFSEGGILWNGSLYRELTFSPRGREASFSLYGVTIGVDFHWQRQETQTFQGVLKLVVEADKVCAVNCLPVEDYLVSVISSEMKSTSSLEFLKAHAVISRSWLLAQMERRRHQDVGGGGFFPFVKNDDELIRWYDRDDHTIFDVCADDHCQRYQGITKANNVHVEQAVRQTCGEILTYDGAICDARFSKCCGGVTEEFQYCWENNPQPYLAAVRDAAGPEAQLPDLTDEAEAERWIRSCPKSYCNTDDARVLSQVLNDFDQETSDFYRWRVEYTQERLAALIADKLKLDLGGIVDLIPVERGRSGRICKLKIVGEKRTFTIGKELEIRRTLSDTHLYSSAFVVDKYDVVGGLPSRFVLVGAGWGHGVGLCQIGAAVMGESGCKYDDILLHYYRGAEIRKIYG